MKKILLLILSLPVFHFLQAQDEAIFTNYHITPVLINPAAAGFEDYYQLQFNARAQWTGFPDAPQTFAAQINGPVANAFGAGLGVSTETAAQMTRLKGQLNWAFKFDAGENFRMAAGFSASYQQIMLDNSVLNSPFIQPGDNIVDENLDGVRDFDASVGIYGKVRESTRMGLAFTNLIQSRLDEMADETNQTGLQYYTFFFGHEFDILDLNFKLEPSIMARRVKDAPSQVDLNLKASFLDDQLITGLSYRTIGAMGVLLGARLSNFNVFYTYDVSFQRFQKFNSGSHEVMIALTFDKKQSEIDKGY
jgi:type IX secretion system PorP/SprF family membrane protein